MAEFSDFFNDEDNIVAATAHLLDAIRQGFERGQLTKEQHDELCEDVLQIEKIDELANDLERKNYVTGIFATFKEIAGVIPI